ncbi:hypothetical protein N7532_009413 [Penicillium argentinense]|uniref:VCBS repeat-containing protein n=1 Tax=Penicillium argentinense TaxID=1131581 RepID=A0A9W9EZH1_9EURO|nr:uncharacterized protein N7532_009413 [Penicillium argentinense]KAJ5090729.1 hypothetical protein N7532_009413 [Penicillium argentinense]
MAISMRVGVVPFGVAEGDLNRDGHSGDNSVSVFLGTGSGKLQSQITFSVGSIPYEIALGDFNKDGHIDIVTAKQDMQASSNDTVSVPLGPGSGGFQTQAVFGVRETPISVAVGVFDKDGNPYIVATNAVSNTVSVLLGNGAWDFQTQVTFDVGMSPVDVIADNFNGDDYLDNLVGNVGENTVGHLLGKPCDS